MVLYIVKNQTDLRCFVDMSGNLQANKIMGAVLATGLIIVGARLGVDALFETEPLTKPGYLIAVADTGSGEAEAVEMMPDWGTLMPSVDMALGEATFKKCASCHSVAAGTNMTGPSLNAVVGRPMASVAGFAYSDAMKAHATTAPNWSYDALYDFLGAPQKVVKGTKMSFVGIKKPEERIALIAYLRAQGSSGYAVPAPDPTRQPGAAVAAPVEAVVSSAAPEAAPVALTEPAA